MGFLREESFDELDGIEKAQRLVSILLYISLISHGLEIFLAFLLGLLAGSLLLVIVGGVIMALSVGLVITVVDGVIVGAVITPLITAPYLMGFGAMGASLLAGAAVGAGVDAGEPGPAGVPSFSGGEYPVDLGLERPVGPGAV